MCGCLQHHDCRLHNRLYVAAQPNMESHAILDSRPLVIVVSVVVEIRSLD